MNRNDQWKVDLRNKESKMQFFHSGTAGKELELNKKWEIPDFLKYTDTAWAKTLIKVYEHPMSFPGSMSPQMGNLLRALIMNIAPKNVVEIGSYIGVSSLWIASAMNEYKKHNKLHCVDLFQSHLNNPWCPGVTIMDPLDYMFENIKKSGFQDFVEIYKGDSSQLLAEIVGKIGEPIDFVLIDGDHSIDGCIKDFNTIEPHVATGGYILFHDVFIDYCGVDGPAYTLLEKIIPSERYEACQIYTTPLNFGFALIRKVAP